MPHRILLYSKPGCHLCEIAHQLLLGLCREFELTIQEQDISQDPSLYETYWDKIPVIVVTAKAQNIDRVLAMHIAKVDDYITKPFSPQELLLSVEKVLGAQETES